ncbi:MAG TPA: iron-sulfur cluster carrier protein ApbC [Nevskiaceae bacterium]|nr:iron-sulfur cluster carrier protein ApbC [Nevskiaceae bacterium]
MTEADLNAALEAFVDPLIGRGLLSAAAVEEVALSAGLLRLRVRLGFPLGDHAASFEQALAAHVQTRLGVRLQLDLAARIESQAVQRQLRPLAGIRNILAVASGKGGVGKSTVAANLALALQAQGARVGLLDADIYGPSQPHMMGVAGQRPVTAANGRLQPVLAHGLQVMSIGFLVDAEQPMIWRGPMATQALNQLLTETDWVDLDYLVVDLPPGTGDIQLSLSQRIPLAGAVVVTTPQDIALIDARKGLEMFRKVGVPLLGIVENMSLYCCPACGQTSELFGRGGGERLATAAGVPLLGQLPLERRIRELADGGRPSVVGEPEGDAARRYRAIALQAAARLAYAGGEAFPEITVSDD